MEKYFRHNLYAPKFYSDFELTLNTMKFEVELKLYLKWWYRKNISILRSSSEWSVFFQFVCKINYVILPVEREHSYYMEP